MVLVYLLTATFSEFKHLLMVNHQDQIGNRLQNAKNPFT